MTLKFLPAAAGSAGGDTSVESLMQVEQVEQLHDVFVAEGGPSKALSVRRFIEVTTAILAAAAGSLNESTSAPPASTTGSRRSIAPLSGAAKLRNDVKRWAITLGTTLTAASGRATDSDLGELKAAAEEAPADSMAKEKFFVPWGDVTTSLIRAEQLRDGMKDQMFDFRRLPLSVRTLPAAIHTFSPSIAVTSTSTGKLVTAGRDGLVKMWNPNTGAFEKNLYNSGFSWIIDVSFSESENLVYVCSSNAQLAVLEFPSGNIVQQYVGSPREDAAVTTVVNRSTIHTQRFGMLPGECGPRKIHFPNIMGITQEEFTERRRVAREGPTFKTVDVKPIVGFVDPTAFCSVTDLHMCVFGTHHGSIGVFDISEDIRQSSLITGSSIKSIHQLMHTRCHANSISALRYMGRNKTLLSTGLDGCIYKTPLDIQVLGDHPIRHNTGDSVPGETLKPILGMDWSERQQVIATYSSDKRIKLWSPMRPEALHSFEALSHDILSIVVIKSTEQFATLTADKMIRIFDLRTFRCIQSIQQSISNEDSTGAALDNNFVSLLKASVDVGGALAYDSHHDQLVCALRSPVYYTTLGHSNDGAGGAAGPPSLVAAAAAVPAPASLAVTPHQTSLLDEAAKTADPTTGVLPLFPSLSGAVASAPPVASVPQTVPRAAHGLPVLDMIYNKSGNLLFSLDMDTIMSWNITTGECLNCAEVVRQVQKLDNLAGKAFKLTKASWATGEHGRIVTGTQAGALVIWNASASVALLVQHLSSPLKLADVATLTFRGPCMIASVCNRTHVMEWNVDKLHSSGAYTVDRQVTIDVPSDSVSASAIIRDSTIALGTVDAKLFLANFDTMVTREVVLGGPGQDEVASVEEILFLNRQNQCSLLVLLEDGQAVLVSALERNVIRRQRLFREGEAELTCAALSPTEDCLAVGDSTGRVRLFLIVPGRSTVHSSTSSTTMFEWTCKLQLISSIQGAYDPIASIRYCDDVNAITVGSEDGFIKLYLIEGFAACQARTARTAELTHVGNFGESMWDLDDPLTFQRSVLQKQQHMLNPPTAAAQEAFGAPADEDFLTTVLRTARRKKYPAPDLGGLGGLGALLNGSRGGGGGLGDTLRSTTPRNSPRYQLMSPLSTARSQQRPDTVPTDGPNTCRELMPFDATMTLTQRPATQPGRSRSQSPRDNSGMPSPPKPQLGLTGTMANHAYGGNSGSALFAGKDATIAIPAPPPYSSATMILERLRGPKLSVKRRVIDAPDVDLGNGMAVKSHGRGEDSPTKMLEDPLLATFRSSASPANSTYGMNTFITALPLLADAPPVEEKVPQSLSSTMQCSSGGGRLKEKLASSENGENEEAELVWQDSLYEASQTHMHVPALDLGGQDLSVSFSAQGHGTAVFSSTAAEVDTARESTKKLLSQMAQRLDLVCPSGYCDKSFSRKLNKLYGKPSAPAEPVPTKPNPLHHEEQLQQSPLDSDGGGEDGPQPVAPMAAEDARPDEAEASSEDENEAAEKFLMQLRTPQTARNVAEMHDRIRQYKRNREVGGGGRQVANWIMRVSSQLKVEKLKIDAPSLISKTTTMNYSFPATARSGRLPGSPRLAHDRLPMTPRK